MRKDNAGDPAVPRERAPRWRPSAISLLFLLSGCVGDGAAPAEAEPAEAHGSPLVLSGGATAVFTELGGRVGYVEGNPCMSFRAEDVDRVLEGSLRAEWTANDAMSEELVLSYYNFGEASTRTEGPSPLALRIEDFTVRRAMTFCIAAADERLVVDQTVALSWNLTYLGRPGATHA